MDAGERPQAAAAREVREETGLAVAPDHLLGIFAAPGDRVVTLCYWVSLTAEPGPITVGEEHTAARIFPPARIPWDSLRDDKHRAALRAWLRARQLPAVPLVAVVGHSGAGKTTLIEQLIPAFSQRGYRVGAIKHDAHGHAAYDREGKDSWRFAQAGAAAVALAGPHQLATFQPSGGQLPLNEVVGRLPPVDLLLVEGYHWHASIPKLEVFRPALQKPPRCEPSELVALATDAVEVPASHNSLPHFDLHDILAIVSFVERTIPPDPVS